MDWKTYKEREGDNTLQAQVVAHVQKVLGYTLTGEELLYLMSNLHAGLAQAPQHGLEVPPTPFDRVVHSLMETYWQDHPRFPSATEVAEQITADKSWFKLRLDTTSDLLNYMAILGAIICVVALLTWAYGDSTGDPMYPEQTDWNAHFAPICDMERGIGIYVYTSSSGHYSGDRDMSAEQFEQECRNHAAR